MRRLRLFTLIALTTFLTVVPLLSKAQTCEGLFNQRLKNARGPLRVEFQHQRSYSNELPEARRVLNQCQMNTCHIFSWLAGLELRAEQPIELSDHYLVARLVLDRAIAAAFDPKLSSEINLGATMNQSRDLFVRYGLIPDTAWAGNRDFKTGDNARKLSSDLKQIIETARANAESPLETKRKLQDYFAKEIGEFPRSFHYRGRAYSPHAFAHAFFPVLQQHLNVLNVSFGRRDKVREYVIRPDYTVFETSLAHIERVAREAIDAGQPVFVAYETNLDYIIERKPSIWSMSAWDHDASKTRVPRAARGKNGALLGSHSVQIVGYDLDPVTKRVVKWKMKNSWGEGAVDDGYFHMYDDYFRAYVLGIAVFDHPHIRLPKIGES